MDFWCVMKVDFCAFHSFWVVTFFWTQCFIGVLIDFFCKSWHWNCFYVAMSRVLRCSLTSCFSISFWIFLGRCNVQTLPCHKWNCFCFMFPSEKLFIDCSKDTDADEEKGVAVCNVRIGSSSLCCDSVFATQKYQRRYLWLVVFT